jgi:DNA-binding NtrC family response regulator
MTRVPSLAERREDIPELALHLVAKHARRLGRTVEGISGRTLEHLASRDWPGSVRELENWLARALIATSGPLLDAGSTAEEARLARAGSSGRGSSQLADVEREHIRRVLEERRWRIEGREGAALVLGLRPSTLRSRMKKLGIVRGASG